MSGQIPSIRISRDAITENGLSKEEATRLLKMVGPNRLREEPGPRHWKLLVEQFRSPVVVTLLGATVLSALLGEIVDAIAISAILVINALIGYAQQVKAERAVSALKKLAAPKARVVRDDLVQEVPVEEIVPGDLLVLEAGDFVPADARLVVASQLTSDESVLTGESLPSPKSTRTVVERAPLAERSDTVFAGTSIATGSGRAKVFATGMSTEIGRIAKLLESSKAGATPLQERLEQVSAKLLVFCAVVVALVALIGLLRGERAFDVLFSAIGLAVAAIPEGLPTVVTLALALAVRRMVKRNAIVRHLPAVETLGSTDVICTDKTGTLTTGKMRVREIVLPQGKRFPVESAELRAEEEFERLCHAMILCSNASIGPRGEATGDPTEVALLVAAREHGLEPSHVFAKFPRAAEWSFDSQRKRMSVAVREAAGLVLHVKGAPESVLPRCAQAVSKDLAAALEMLSARGMRLLAVASRRLPQSPDFPIASLSAEEIESSLTFLGLVAIADPPRPESISAIRQCAVAGIKVVMITGDHPTTAQAIARELGIIREEGGKVVSGPELEDMTDEALREKVIDTAVYARVSPEHKLRVIRAWQSLGKVVAMTGDGVNDAPALKAASIGISMGKGGTEVARQASSMILTDDNFSTIVAAVEEGRAIYGNIRRTIQYLLSGNLAEILIMFGAAILGWPAPLAPLHLLWINLVTDGLPSLALAAEPVPKGKLAMLGRPSSGSFLDRHFYQEIGFVSGLVTILALGVYGYFLKHSDETSARTHLFSFLVFAELFRSFASRSDHYTFFQLGAASNIYHLVAVAFPIGFQLLLHHAEWFQGIFKVNYVGWTDCIALIGLTLIPVTAVELRKCWRQRNNRRTL